jgi:predicted RNA-binding Zn-ribbon protein involved in translation (DUF1610 family)
MSRMSNSIAETTLEEIDLDQTVMCATKKVPGTLGPCHRVAVGVAHFDCPKCGVFHVWKCQFCIDMSFELGYTLHIRCNKTRAHFTGVSY